MSLFNMGEKAYLMLADGQVFEGRSFGAKGTVIGEVVFTTGVTGYQETLTDPSYYGQIVTQTFPLIGNYVRKVLRFRLYRKGVVQCSLKFPLRGKYQRLPQRPQHSRHQ